MISFIIIFKWNYKLYNKNGKLIYKGVFENGIIK